MRTDTQVMIHFSCSAQHSSTSFPKLALVIRSLSSHQFLFSSFLPLANSGALCPYLKLSRGYFERCILLACQEGCYTMTHTPPSLSLPFCCTGIIIHQALLRCEDRLAERLVLTVKTAFDMLQDRLIQTHTHAERTF